jgi:hypothetical protein
MIVIIAPKLREPHHGGPRWIKRSSLGAGDAGKKPEESAEDKVYNAYAVEWVVL